jgi:hypothetical protein
MAKFNSLKKHHVPYVSPHQNPLTQKNFRTKGSISNLTDQDWILAGANGGPQRLSTHQKLMRYTLDQQYSQDGTMPQLAQPIAKKCTGYDFAGVPYSDNHYFIWTGRKNIRQLSGFQNSSSFSTLLPVTKNYSFTNPSFSTDFVGKEFTLLLQVQGKASGTIEIRRWKDYFRSTNDLADKYNLANWTVVDTFTLDPEKEKQTFITTTVVIPQNTFGKCQFITLNNLNVDLVSYRVTCLENAYLAYSFLCPSEIPSGWTANPKSHMDYFFDRRCIRFEGDPIRSGLDFHVEDRSVFSNPARMAENARIGTYNTELPFPTSSLHDFAYYPTYDGYHFQSVIKHENDNSIKIGIQKNQPPSSAFGVGLVAAQTTMYSGPSTVDLCGEFRNIRVWAKSIEAPGGTNATSCTVKLYKATDGSYEQKDPPPNFSQYALVSTQTLAIGTAHPDGGSFVDIVTAQDTSNATKGKLKNWRLAFEIPDADEINNLNLCVVSYMTSPMITPIPFDVLCTDENIKIPGALNNFTEGLVQRVGKVDVPSGNTVNMGRADVSTTQKLVRFLSPTFSSREYTIVKWESTAESGSAPFPWDFHFTLQSSGVKIHRRGQKISGYDFEFAAFDNIITLQEVTLAPVVLPLGTKKLITAGQRCDNTQYLFYHQPASEGVYEFIVEFVKTDPISDDLTSDPIEVATSLTDALCCGEDIHSYNRSYYNTTPMYLPEIVREVSEINNENSYTFIADVSGSSSLFSGNTGKLGVYEPKSSIDSPGISGGNITFYDDILTEGSVMPMGDGIRYRLENGQFKQLENAIQVSTTISEENVGKTIYYRVGGLPDQQFFPQHYRVFVRKIT